MTSRVARRYAKALFGLAQESGSLDAIATELDQLRQAFSDPTSVTVLASPTVGPARLQLFVKKLASEMKLSALTAHFLGVLAENRRINELAAVSEHFQRMHDRALGRVRITIQTAAPLTPARQSEIVAAFEKQSGKTVLATVEIVPALLGGVVVDIEGKVYDGSLRTQFEHLAHEMTGARTYL